MFAVGLYTGLRPNEYKTAIIEGDFIVANNSKRKNGKVELKRIPINPMLKPYLGGVTDIKFVRLEAMRMKLSKYFQTTSYTICVPLSIRAVWNAELPRLQ